MDGFRWEGGELGTSHGKHVQKGDMRDCWGRNLSKGDGIYPLEPTSTLPKLCSELETPAPSPSPAEGKEKGQSPLYCQRAYWVVGLCYSPQTVTHRQTKGIQSLQNQWDGRNSSVAGLESFSGLGRASPEACCEMGIRTQRIIRKGAGLAGSRVGTGRWLSLALSPTSCVIFSKFLYLSSQFPCM